MLVGSFRGYENPAGNRNWDNSSIQTGIERAGPGRPEKLLGFLEGTTHIGSFFCTTKRVSQSVSIFLLGDGLGLSCLPWTTELLSLRAEPGARVDSFSH